MFGALKNPLLHNRVAMDHLDPLVTLVQKEVLEVLERGEMLALLDLQDLE